MPELRRETIEAFMKAYKNDYGKDLTYEQAYEMAHRLVNIFLILEKAHLKEQAEEKGIEFPEDVS